MFFKILFIVDVFNKSGFSLIKSINSVLLTHFKYLSIYVSALVPLFLMEWTIKEYFGRYSIFAVLFNNNSTIFLSSTTLVYL